MTPERMAGLVARWVRLYTRNLPGPVAERRIGEIDADLHDHIAHERAHGAGDRRLALGIAGRMLRGVAADAAWRSSNRKEARPMDPLPTRSYLRVAIVTGLILLIPAFSMLVSAEADWGVFDFVLAAVLLAGTGLLLELAVRRPRSIAFRAGAGVIAVAAIVLGEADDAPGLVGFGCLVIAGTVALSLRAARAR